jgi:hypothetical protein
MLEQFLSPKLTTLKEHMQQMFSNKKVPNLMSAYGFGLLWMLGFQTGGLEDMDQ